MDTYKTKVVFRKWRNGQIIAMFPRILGNYSAATCMSYEHTGQHGAASDTISTLTVLAKPSEYAPLARELESLGYVLDIRKRITRADYEFRKSELDREAERADYEHQKAESERVS